MRRYAARQYCCKGNALYALTSERLHLTPLAATDLAALHSLWTSAGVRRYLWDAEIVPLSHTAGIIEESERLFASRNFGLWGAWCKGEPDLIGFGGFWFFRDPPELELLYGVAEQAWNRNFATEIAQTLIGHGMRTLGMQGIRGSTDAANTASIRVLEKLGFRFERRATIVGVDTVFYRLDAHRDA